MKFVFFELILNILCNLFRVLSCCVHVISTAPKASIPIFIFQIPMSFMDQDTALSFEKSLYGFLSSRIIPAGFSLSLLCVLRRISFADILVQTRYDICSSMLYVLDYCCHSPSAIRMSSFWYFSAVIRPHFHLTKRSFSFIRIAKAFPEPPAQPGGSLDKKSPQAI